MAQTTVDAFTPNTVLKSGKKGLNTKSGSTSNVTIAGSDLAQNQLVTIKDKKNAPREWTGNLGAVAIFNGKQQATADVTEGKGTKHIGPKDNPTDISVTVGGSNPTPFNNVNTGDGP